MLHILDGHPRDRIRSESERLGPGRGRRAVERAAAVADCRTEYYNNYRHLRLLRKEGGREGGREGGSGGRDSEGGGRGGVRNLKREPKPALSSREEGESARGVASLSSGGVFRGSPPIESLPRVGGQK